MLESEMRKDEFQTGHTRIGSVQEIVIIWQIRNGHVGEFREELLSFGFGFEISAQLIG
jgi:hypothetical protein